MRSEVTTLISIAPEEIALPHHWIPAPGAYTWRGRQGGGYVSAGGFAGGGEILLLGFGDSYVWSNRGDDILQVRWTDIRSMHFSLPNQRVRDDETEEWFAAAEAEEDDFEYPDESSNSQVSSGLEEERRQYLEDHGDPYYPEYGSPSDSDSVSPSVADDDLDNLWRLAERGPAQRARWIEIYHAMHARVEFHEAVADLPGDELEPAIRAWRAEHPEYEHFVAPMLSTGAWLGRVMNEVAYLERRRGPAIEEEDQAANNDVRRGARAHGTVGTTGGTEEYAYLVPKAMRRDIEERRAQMEAQSTLDMQRPAHEVRALAAPSDGDPTRFDPVHDQREQLAYFDALQGLSQEDRRPLFAAEAAGDEEVVLTEKQERILYSIKFRFEEIRGRIDDAIRREEGIGREEVEEVVLGESPTRARNEARERRMAEDEAAGELPTFKEMAADEKKTKQQRLFEAGEVRNEFAQLAMLNGETYLGNVRTIIDREGNMRELKDDEDELDYI
ncbi:hypothetical protein B0A48_01897 [Cryoendolithus antarcticus]|uniref:Uncharacterized protein n=1 Tax=Cryoendolithus antarcticus TaxID=1507870 RepID=A0A1V8TQW4_9PEZI|nr:hypothetical protein B0A48_01897 [Cryoendolithus antarcticus]